MNALENIKESILRVKYELERNKYIEDTIANIGEIVEDEYSITCYVKQELLDRNAKKSFYELCLLGMKSKEIVDYYKLNKPVSYIFDGITFNVPIILSAYFCNVTFVNCVFLHSYFKILNADKITFAGNKFYDGTSSIHEGAFFRTTSNCKIGELVLKNERFINQYERKEYGENNFGIDINADEINIINSAIITDGHNEQISMKAKKIKIRKSFIESSRIFLDASTVVDVDRKSKLESKKEIIVGNVDSNCDVDICLDNIFSPLVVFNNVEMVNYEKGDRTFFHDNPVKLNKKRTELLQLLNNISDQCKEKDFEIYNGSLSIKMILKKKNEV